MQTKFTEVSDYVKNHYEFSQISRIISLAEKRKKQNLQNPPFLVQYGGYRVENLAETFSC